MRLLLQAAFKDRPEHTMAGGREAFVQSIFDRKHRLEEDFLEFYQSIYREVGLVWDIEEGVFLNEGFVGVTQELLDVVSRNGGHGMSTFYASQDIEGAAEFFWEELRYLGDGKPPIRVLAGEIKLRKDADERLIEFINNKLGIAPSSLASEGLPHNDGWWTKVENAIKTANNHALDGDYNTSVLLSMRATRATLLRVVNDN